ncbi:hypothetical protein WG66_001949 [Moniliophthora roreri]|nr:hypothetical protein WG66_001949 [Moniliophthora roreri]
MDPAKLCSRSFGLYFRYFDIMDAASDDTEHDLQPSFASACHEPAQRKLSYILHALTYVNALLRTPDLPITLWNTVLPMQWKLFMFVSVSSRRQAAQLGFSIRISRNLDYGARGGVMDPPTSSGSGLLLQDEICTSLVQI